jgi:hypothetical protein
MSGLASLLSPDPDLIAGCCSAQTHVFDHNLKLSAALAAAQLAFSAAADVLGNRVKANADAWAPALPAAPFSNSSTSGGCPLGFSNPAVYKQYPVVHVPSTLSLLTPKQLLWLFLKNSGIVLLLQVRSQLKQPQCRHVTMQCCLLHLQLLFSAHSVKSAADLCTKAQWAV